MPYPVPPPAPPPVVQVVPAPASSSEKVAAVQRSPSPASLETGVVALSLPQRLVPPPATPTTEVAEVRSPTSTSAAIAPPASLQTSPPQTALPQWSRSATTDPVAHPVSEAIAQTGDVTSAPSRALPQNSPNQPSSDSPTSAALTLEPPVAAPEQFPPEQFPTPVLSTLSQHRLPAQSAASNFEPGAQNNSPARSQTHSAVAQTAPAPNPNPRSASTPGAPRSTAQPTAQRATDAARLDAMPAQTDWFPALTGIVISPVENRDRPLVIVPSSPVPGLPSSEVLQGQTSTESSPNQPSPAAPSLTPESTAPATPGATPTPAETVPIPPGTGSGTGEPIEITADRQDFDNIRKIFIAEGNVVMRFRQAILRADRVQVNLPNRVAVAEGNVSLVRGDQEIRGDRFVYNFVQEQGTVLNARGEVFIPSADEDFSIALPTDVGAGSADAPEIVRPDRPVEAGGIEFGVGGRRGPRLPGAGQPTNEVRRIRFEADQIEFNPNGWVATNVRLTNDPFSPPELELRSRRVTYTRLDQDRSEIIARNPRLVFDQGFSLPLFRERTVIDNRQRDALGLGSIRYDGDLGGFFLERPFTIIQSPQVRFTVAPRLLIQRIVNNDFDLGDASGYALRSRLDVNFSPLTTLRGTAVLNSFNFNDFEDEFRASLRLRQAIATPLGDHNLALEYSYRDRLFNGSLGFQDVQSSLGLVLTSPVIPLGRSGFAVSYQAGTQIITADTDRLDLLDPIRDNNRISLTRYQGSAALGWGRVLWQGEALPRTPTEGMRFTPNPLVPSVVLTAGLTGVYSHYSNGDNQSSLTGSVGVRAQLGNFSRDFLDYTLVDLTYSRTALDGASPFLFDRVVDTQVLSALFLQQIYGPFRVGVQTFINLDDGNEIDTAYILDYSRRTYGITLRYNPIRESGSVTLRISDFNWGSFQRPFAEPEDTGTVQQGVRRDND